MPKTEKTAKNEFRRLVKNKEILDSWKAIAAYLERDIKTCYRWEKELGLPVHRIADQSSRSKVFAYKSEIDSWLREKATDKDIIGKPKREKRRKVLRLTAACLLTAATLLFLYLGFKKARISLSETSFSSNDFPLAFEEIEGLDNIGSVSSVDRNSILRRIDEGSLEPWQLYHQGRYYLDQKTQESNELAIILFLQVINAEENATLAYLGLAQCYINNVEFEWKLDIEWLNKADNLTEKAGDESRKYPEYFCVLAKTNLLKAVYFDENTLSNSQKLIEEGITVFPDHPQLNSLAGDFYYIIFGSKGRTQDFDLALKYKEKAFWLNPYSLSNVEYAELLMLEKKFQAAAEVCHQIQNIDPTSMAKFRLGEIYYYSNALDKSEKIFEQFTTPLNLKIASLYYKGMIASQRNEEDNVRLVVQEIKLLTLEGGPPGFEHLIMASMFFGLKDEDNGYKYLDLFFSSAESKKKRFIVMMYIDLDQNFEFYRNQKRFRKTISLE